MSDAASAPTVALPALRLQVGSLFADRYEVLSGLGSGGMGDVYRVRDVELSEEIALKVLRHDIAAAPGALDRFRREVKLARRVTHPNVARTYDLGTHDLTRYLTMELIVGQPLSRIMGRGTKVPLADALRIASEVVRGLAAAHAVGVVHRDLKPDNILLGHLDGRVVITDFGVARLAEGAVGQAATRLTLAAGASAVGTPAYMAPEQLEGRELDGRADLYAFGVLLFEMLTGELPFHGETIYALAASRLSSPPVDPRTLDPSIPDGVASLVLASLARHRDDRLDAQQALDRLESIRGGGASYEEPIAGPQSTITPSRSDAIGVSSIELGVLAQSSARRTLAIAPFSTTDAATEAAARDLGRALADALTGLPGYRTLTPGAVHGAAATHVLEGTLDAAAFGRSVAADVVVDGSIRIASGKVRARVRTIDVASGAQTWADRFEGAVDEPFALEDRLIAAVDSAMRMRRTTDSLGRPGPSDPAVRAIYDRARAAYNKYALPHVKEAIQLLEDAVQRAPDEPYMLSLLGQALVRAWLMMGAGDRSMIVRAEEVSLRALAADPTIADTYYTIGVVRGSQGELRAAVRALQDAVARNPLLSEPHSQLGRWMSESGRLEEGSHRLDLAIRLEPNSLYAYLERARNFALTGDRQRAELDLERAERIGGPMSMVVLRMRLAIWWNDRAMAGRCADTIEAAKSGGAFEAAIPLLRAIAAGEVLPHALELFERVAGAARASPRQRAVMWQSASEYLASVGHDDDALLTLERAAELPIVDLLWLDNCPSLERIRKLPRFAKARAIVAARAAQIWA